jgi:hypothetical protein
MAERIERLAERVQPGSSPAEGQPGQEGRPHLLQLPPRESRTSRQLPERPSESLYEMANRLHAEVTTSAAWAWARPARQRSRRGFSPPSTARAATSETGPGRIGPARPVRKGGPHPPGDLPEWFAKLPQALRDSILKSWGPVEKSQMMLWRDAQGEAFLVLRPCSTATPFLPPSLPGLGAGPEKLYHDLALAPITSTWPSTSGFATGSRPMRWSMWGPTDLGMVARKEVGFSEATPPRPCSGPCPISIPTSWTTWARDPGQTAGTRRGDRPPDPALRSGRDRRGTQVPGGLDQRLPRRREKRPLLAETRLRRSRQRRRSRAS